MSELERHKSSCALAFDEGARALDAQERAVNELRSRAGVLIAAAAITTSFFGLRAIPGGELTAASWSATIAFALLAAAVLVVLWPWRDGEFSASPEDMIATTSPATLAEIHRDMALHRAASYDGNAVQLGRLYWAFRVGLVLLAVAVSAWIVALSGQD